MYYLKDTNDKNVGDLYCNGDSVLSDVSVYSVQDVYKRQEAGDAGRNGPGMPFRPSCKIKRIGRGMDYDGI